MLFILKIYWFSIDAITIITHHRFIGLLLLWFTRWQRCGKAFTTLSLV